MDSLSELPSNAGVATVPIYDRILAPEPLDLNLVLNPKEILLTYTNLINRHFNLNFCNLSPRDRFESGCFSLN